MPFGMLNSEPTGRWLVRVLSRNAPVDPRQRAGGSQKASGANVASRLLPCPCMTLMGLERVALEAQSGDHDEISTQVDHRSRCL